MLNWELRCRGQAVLTFKLKGELSEPSPKGQEGCYAD
jgi:hypothetical protein